MQIIKTTDDIPRSYRKSIFLAGPSIRIANLKDYSFKDSWRYQACQYLEKIGYDGVVFIPEPMSEDYMKQIQWEDQCLNMADVILFWVPRSTQLPGFTTNIEYGEWMKSGKAVLGFPDSATHVRYLEQKARIYKVPLSSTLEATVKTAVEKIGDGALRSEGERFVPCYIWKTASFQQWYRQLQKTGNRLDRAQVLWTFRVGPQENVVFSWILHVDIYIIKEDRHKTNEFVLSRTDISVVFAFRIAEKPSEAQVIIIKEFRSPCSNDEGMVYELPGGSSKDSLEHMQEVIAKELREEVGLEIPREKFIPIQSRQLCSTLSAHKAHLFSLILDDDQWEQLNKMKGKIHGEVQDTERTYTEVWSLSDILKSDLIDWSMLGMSVRALAGSWQEAKKASNVTPDWVGNFLTGLCKE